MEPGTGTVGQDAERLGNGKKKVARIWMNLGDVVGEF